jgi:hypothetical protein
VSGLQGLDRLNVLKHPKKAAEGDTVKWYDTGNTYRVVRCVEPLESKEETRLQFLNGKPTMWVELVSRGPGPLCPIHKTKMKPTDERDMPEVNFYYCPEPGCKRRYSYETRHITTDDLPSRNSLDPTF